MKTIPLVDLSKIQLGGTNDETKDWIETADEIRKGLGSVGFLYLTNHGIPEKVISDAMKQSKEFFNLPLDVKEKYGMDVTEAAAHINKLHGYRPQGGEKLHEDGKFEMKETFDWQPYDGVCPTKELPDFQIRIEEFNMHCRKLMKKLLKLLAMSLKLSDIDFFLNACLHLDNPSEHIGLQDLRLLHYPPVDTNVSNEKLRNAVRCGQHADYLFLSLLFQDDVGGLEVKTVNGDWVQANPIPGTILVNTGNLTEFWTSGIFPATPHRISIPDDEDVRRTKSRQSMVFFTGPDCATLICPMDIPKTQVEAERLAINATNFSKDPVNANDYVMGLVAKMYDQGYA